MTRHLFSGNKKGLPASVILIFSVYLLTGFTAGELLTRVDFIGHAANILFSYSLPVLAAVFAMREHERRDWLKVLLLATLLTAIVECAYLSMAYYPAKGFELLDYLSSFAYLATVSMSIYLMAFAAGRLFKAGMTRLLHRA